MCLGRAGLAVTENKYSSGWTSENVARGVGDHLICLYVIKTRTPFNVCKHILFCLKFSVTRKLLYNACEVLKKQLLAALF